MGLRMRIAIASDHAALDLKAELRDWLIEQGHEVADLGPDTADSVDYPDFGYRLASVVADGTAERGLAIATIRNQQVVIISPAPQAFGGAGF